MFLDPTIVPGAAVGHMDCMKLRVIIEEVALPMFDVNPLHHIDWYYYHHDIKGVICYEVSSQGLELELEVQHLS